MYNEAPVGDNAWNIFTSDVSPGDDRIAIAVFINSNNKTSGHGMISNINKKTVHKVNFTTGSSLPLCGQSGGWYIQINQTGSSEANFGTLDFQNAEVNTSAGMYCPGDLSLTQILNVPEGSQVMYTFKTNGTTVMTQHV